MRYYVLYRIWEASDIQPWIEIFANFILAGFNITLFKIIATFILLENKIYYILCRDFELIKKYIYENLFVTSKS